MMNQKTDISIVIPCRDEEKFIGKCLDSIIANEFPKDKLEVLIIDGISKDGTKEILKKYSEKYPYIKILDNTKKNVPVALNKGIRHATAEIIIRMDAHTLYAKNYISNCLRYLKEYDVDNVGGICVTLPGASSVIGQTIAMVLTHPFGVGNAFFRIGTKKPRFVDTVPFGCYRKSVFERIGLFNEDLLRNQDIEFNVRLKNAGGKILLVPTILSYYHARDNLKDFFEQNFSNGFWVIYGLKFTKRPFSLRHLMPFIFVFSLFFSFTLCLVLSFFIYVFVTILSSYLITNIVFSFMLSLKKRLVYFPAIMLAFSALHLSYGLGAMWGIVKLNMSKIRSNLAFAARNHAHHIRRFPHS